MITKLPQWVWSGAWVLAFIAGIVNVVGLLGFDHQTVTHLTGTTSMLAAAVAALDGRLTLHFSLVIGSFVAGTVLSGFIIQDSTLKLGRRYGVVLLLESMLLCGSVLLLQYRNEGGIYLASGAVGLQNAMLSTYSGAVVRTTHLSGMFTDLGISLGHTLRVLPVDRLRLRRSGRGGFFSSSRLFHIAHSRRPDWSNICCLWTEYIAAWAFGAKLLT